MTVMNPLTDHELEIAYQTNEAFDVVVSWQKRCDNAYNNWEEAKEGWQRAGYDFVPRQDELEAMNIAYDGLAAAKKQLRPLLPQYEQGEYYVPPNWVAIETAAVQELETLPTIEDLAVYF